MEDYNIPESTEELFANGDQHYHIHNHHWVGDNTYSMNLFLDCANINEECIIVNDGTQIIVSNGTITLQIDAYGGGDFHLHEYDVKII